MALSQRNLQAKREKRHKKRKNTLASRAQILPKFSIYETILSNNIWESGIGLGCLVLINHIGELTIVNFKIDVFFLGIKDSFVRNVNYEQYFAFKEMYGESEDFFIDVEPSYLKALIFESVKYAKQFEMHPRGDFAKAVKYFQNIKLPEVMPNFIFGKDGKPFYVSGPYDSLKMSKSIVEKLQNSVGKGNFDYMIAVPEDLLFDEDESEIELLS